MNTIFSILFVLAVLAIGLWISWNVIEVIYRVVMITVLGIGYLFLTIWEAITSVIHFAIIKPAWCLFRLVR